MPPHQRRSAIPPVVGAKSIGDHEDDHDLKYFSHHTGHWGWWCVGATCLALILTAVAVTALVFGIAAFSTISSFITTGDSLSSGDTVIVGDTSLPFQRHEASCAVSTRLSETPIPDFPGLPSLRHLIFDLAACIPGGLDFAPPFAGFSCRDIVIPPPIGGLLPCDPCGSGCPFGTLTLGTIYSTGGAVVPSDERIKEQIQGYNTRDALNVIKRLRPKTYYHTEEFAATFDQAHRYPRHGFISQEVEEVLPGSIRTFGNYTIGESTYENFKLLKKEDLIVHLAGAIQEHDKVIRGLEDELALLKSQMQT